MAKTNDPVEIQEETESHPEGLTIQVRSGGSYFVPAEEVSDEPAETEAAKD
jgi:hypothetical protein